MSARVGSPRPAALYSGIDGAEDHHDIALVDDEGELAGNRRINESVEGFAELLGLFAELGARVEALIPVVIDTPRGLLVAALRASGWSTELSDQPTHGRPVSATDFSVGAEAIALLGGCPTQPCTTCAGRLKA